MDEERNSDVRDVNISAPEIGMTFINFDAVLNFYKHYAQEIGFAVVKRSTKMTDGKATYVIIACSRHGKMYRTVTNIRPRPSVAKTNCPARINVVINADSSCYGDGGKDVPFTVYFDEGTSLVSCICRLFEYKGILCRHSIAVLVHRKLMIVPNSYILTRWRKDVRRRYTRVKTWHKNLGSTAEIYRYEEVCRNMYDIADIAAESDEKCELALRTLRDLKTKLENTSSSKGSNDIEYSPIAATPSNDASNGRSNDQRVLSPLPVRSKGRPPSKRKESTTDKIVKSRSGLSLRIMHREPTGSGS
ncbi:Protein FAR-RED ELONGATED HYPOCOTYL 3 [Ananas comosus]|uniref:Protein FAR1-RELATED SEQUENCE n=1 Tax=Ananas comosus TaxID=4615 RepID=A0A199VDI2_ANACO|nr:Protein FAR-RED ELONGATED HYPOCOTYL 3 [Ananas comosus]